jgi:hypothetical protein
MKRILQVSVLALALIGLGGARATSLADLLAGGSITAGDKVFDQFTLLSFVAADATHVLDAANIDVTPLNDGAMDPGPGLAFAVSNDELTTTGDGIFNFIDLAFGFRVTAPAGFLVHDNSLYLTGVTLTSDIDFEDLGTTILEWVDPNGFVADPSTPGYISTEISNLAGVGTNSTPASSTFAPHQSIFVTNDLLVWATNRLETARLTAFEQRFSQQVAGIPEPGTLALLLVGMVALGAGLRRRNA